MTPSILALIPARAGSKRIPGKNTKLLGEMPLIQWTIDAAHESDIFDDVVVCSDMPEHQIRFNARGYWQRTTSTDNEPDITWATAFFDSNVVHRETCDAFAILRPSSPFRTGETILRAWASFLAQQPCDSLRAIEPVRQHPGKMWTVGTDGFLIPIMPYKHRDGTPWHSSPTQSLKPCYVQNSSLEIAWTKTVRETNTISGAKILPFFTEGDEGFSIDYPGDFEEAERRLAQRTVTT